MRMIIMKKNSEYSKMDAKGLEQKLTELRSSYAKEYVKGKVGSKTEKAVNLRNIKRDIARVLTFLNQKSN